MSDTFYGSNYARQDPRVPRYMAAAGHYEFGPQRIPIRLDQESGDRIESEWDRGDDAAGYAVQWAEIYRFVDALRSSSESLANQILIVRHEDFCAHPHEELRRILQHLNVDPAALDAMRLDHIAESAAERDSRSEEYLTCVWQHTARVARRFGYSWTDDTSALPEYDGDLSRTSGEKVAL